VPAPLLREQGILVRNRVSLISAGTERMMLELSRKSLIGKARERPDLLQKVLDKLRSEGFLATFKAVRNRLDSNVPMGYSACGEVLEIGARARKFEVGQSVACAGAGYANHAEVNYIPRLLAVAVPLGVSAESAAYSTVGAIALQGVRNADVQVGETAVVLGMGLIGQLTVQLLKTAGCRVVGLDPGKDRVELAAANGADLALVTEGEPTEQEVLRFTRGRGADTILITAATKVNEPVEQAARLARDRARVVMVGVTGMNIPRSPYFKKELTFIVSRSYGPGRYDPQYEEHGHDYPEGYVRWTENRNIEAFLDLVVAGSVRPEVCTTHRFPITEAEAAFDLILADKEPYLGVLLTYPEESGSGAVAKEPCKISLSTSAESKPVDNIGVSFVGAGNFAQAVLLPAVAKCNHVAMRGVCTSSGISARSAGEKFGFAFCTSGIEEILEDTETDVVFVVTHDSQHADLAGRALAAGKTVFVEKPLAVTLDQVKQLHSVLQKTSRLMVGFNRRFAPLSVRLKESFSGRVPLCVQYRCNAGAVDPDHWVASAEHGGRIIGEACHFFDFFAFLTESAPRRVYAVRPGDQTGTNDAQVTVEYVDGSICQLLYTTQGSPSFSKERVEVFAGGKVAVLEDFRQLHVAIGGRKPKRHRLLQAEKGHAEEVRAFLDAVRTGRDMPVAIDSIVNTTLTSLGAVASMQRREPVELSEFWAKLRSRPEPPE